MEINRLKIELMQKIIACKDPDLLLKLEDLLSDPGIEVKEEAEEYGSKTKDGLSLNPTQKEELERRYLKYSREENLESVERKLRKKYGL